MYGEESEENIRSTIIQQLYCRGWLGLRQGIVYEEEANGLHLIEYEEFSLGKPSYMVLGLPDTGLVGVIASNHMVDSLGLKEVAGIDYVGVMPPIAVIREGNLRTPIRIFKGEGLLVVTAETPIPPSHMYQLTNFLVDYAQRKGVEYIISIVGIATPNRMELPKPRVFWLAGNDKARKLVEGLDIEMFSNGFLVGPYALILKNSVKRRIANLVLLAEAYIEFPDPEAAAEVAKLLSRVIGIDIDVAKLLDQAELIRLKLRELMRQTKQSMGEVRAPSPLMYA